ncbi:hypothetical protein CQ018_08815 [Arthrobacter sp. MYb227]|uniref:DNA polymerase III subunit beta family protein n=1 Tax=Arthrobacter sp. MYb227 TaxID=1848601 RepID=UPI000CFDC260|nr:MerR family transcriptional regulator [Arthrobacter sp. MYb227]PQZ93746.1 hypothetical protein CQ018_08815 [Arthrobacter sp. MYb227]
MENELFSIGDTSRQSGLSVSALRFYDRVGLLVPAWVDPATAYRWYSQEQIHTAELVAVLRRVGLALPEISLILSPDHDKDVLREVLAEHVVRLEQGLTSAKAKVGQIVARWGTDEGVEASAEIKVSSQELRAALSSVRFAMGDDEQFPALHGILFEAAEGFLNVSATDRFRAAFYSMEAATGVSTLRKVLAKSAVEELNEFLQPQGEVTLTFADDLHLVLGGGTLTCRLLDVDFPDLTHLTTFPEEGCRAEVDREWLRQTLGEDLVAERWLIEIDADGELLVGSQDEARSEQHLLLQAQYLSEAIEAAGSGQLSLEINGQFAPLAIRRTDKPGAFSILMPIRRDKP